MAATSADDSGAMSWTRADRPRRRVDACCSSLMAAARFSKGDTMDPLLTLTPVDEGLTKRFASVAPINSTSTCSSTKLCGAVQKPEGAFYMFPEVTAFFGPTIVAKDFGPVPDADTLCRCGISYPHTSLYVKHHQGGPDSQRQRWSATAVNVQC